MVVTKAKWVLPSTDEEWTEAFYSSAHSLGIRIFGKAESKYDKLIDPEDAVVLLGIVSNMHSLKFLKFMPVLVSWLSHYHGLLNPSRLSDRLSIAFSEISEKDRDGLGFFISVLKSVDPRAFKALPLHCPREAFYLDPRFASLTDLMIEESGLYFDKPELSNYKVAKGTIRIRLTDFLEEKELFEIQPKLKIRKLFGPTYRSDALFYLKGDSELTAADISRLVGVSYEPAH
ncbi:MAG: hypothetical protein EOP06_06585, partial [Proteobacteria bacterium]